MVAAVAVGTEVLLFHQAVLAVAVLVEFLVVVVLQEPQILVVAVEETGVAVVTLVVMAVQVE
jgi:hypothetical protein